MRKALFLRLSSAEKRKGTQCADAGSPISLNIRDPISDISKKFEIGVMNHEKNGRKNATIGAFEARSWRSHRQYHHCRRYGRRGAGGCRPRQAQADRRERYITEEQSLPESRSLEQMEEDALLPDYAGAETAPSAETEALEREELRNLAEQKQILLLALLSPKGYRPGTHQRPCSSTARLHGNTLKRMGVSQRAVIKRRDRILRISKKFF